MAPMQQHRRSGRTRPIGRNTLDRIELRRERAVAVESSPATRLINAAQGDRGHPLPSDLQASWSQRLGRSVDDVRVHADSATGRMVQDTGVNAISHGNDVFFAPGRFAPGTSAGRALLGHELAHSLQTDASSRSGSAISTRSPALERQADGVGHELSDGRGPISDVPNPEAEPALRGDKSITFSGGRITVSDTYVLRGPAVSDEVVTRFQAALDEYYNGPSFEYRGYDVTFRLSARAERTVTRTAGVVDWESTDWSNDSDTSMMTVESGTGRAGGSMEISIYDTSSKGTIAHEVGHYLSDRVGYFSEGYTENLLTRLGSTLGISDSSTEIRPEAISEDGTVDIMGSSQTGVVSTFSLSGILDDAIDDHEEELEDRAREARSQRELQGARRALGGDPASIGWLLRGLSGG